MTVLMNLDVPDLEKGIAFYAEAFGLRVSRRFGEDGAEMSGWPVALYLLRNAQDSTGAPGSKRNYERHWTPLHMDIVVDDIDAALSRATRAGAVIERPVKVDVWGKIAVLSDPFGHGFCLIQFLNRGYEEIADQAAR
jgi:predicted enzyme related to lactoylglutathione lyase